ncbi:MAG: hypothetical protein GXO15_02695 [Crenarchaeota archaeon]|nr:hypothetical protein [Thermoproteota archaeon]
MRLEDCIAAVLQLILSPECSEDLGFGEAVRLVEQMLKRGSVTAPGRVPCLSRVLRGIEQANEEAERRLAECMDRCDTVRRVLDLLAELGAAGEASAGSPHSHGRGSG